MADGDEHTGDRETTGLARHRVPEVQCLDLGIAQNVVDDGVPGEFDLRVVEGPSLHDLGRPEIVTSVDQGHLASKTGQEAGLLEGRVAATHHGDLLVSEEEPVARGAGRKAVSDESSFGLQAQHDRPGTGGHHHGVGRVGRLGSLGITDPDPERSGR